MELISSDSKTMVEVKYILTLEAQTLSSEIEVSNTSLSSSVQLRGSIIDHLIVSTPDATYALGLEGSSFYSRPPILSNFTIIPPDLDQEQSFWRLWENLPLKGFLQAREEAGVRNYEENENIEGEEEDNYKRLTEEMSLIYTSAPTYLTVIDRVCLLKLDGLTMFCPLIKANHLNSYEKGSSFNESNFTCQIVL